MKYSVNIDLSMREEQYIHEIIAEFDLMFDKMVADGFYYSTIKTICDHFYWEIDKGMSCGFMRDGGEDENPVT